MNLLIFFFLENQYYPTTAEIAEAIGIKSRGVVHRNLKALSELGYIELVPNKRRNIRLSVDHQLTDEIPLLGKIAAGSPIEAVARQESISIASLFLGPGRYALRVQGDSMVDDGIFDGDIIICQKADTAQNGKIVVALVDNESATLKRLRMNRDGTVSLLPANAEYAEQIYAADRVKVQGVFIGLLRM